MNKNNYVIGPKIQTDEFFLFWVEEKRKTTVDWLLIRLHMVLGRMSVPVGGG